MLTRSSPPLAPSPIGVSSWHSTSLHTLDLVKILILRRPATRQPGPAIQHTSKKELATTSGSLRRLPYHTMIKITELSNELLDKVCAHLTKKSLKALRLTCRKLVAVSSARLFRRVTTRFLGDRTIERLSGLVKSSVVSKVKAIRLAPDMYFYKSPADFSSWFERDCDRLVHANEICAQFPNLQDIFLHGRYDYMKCKDWVQEVGSMSVAAWMRAIYSSLCRRTARF